MGSGSVLRVLAWWWIASMYSWDYMLNYAQLFGIPFRKAKYAPSTTEQVKGELRQMMQSMGSSGYCLLENNCDVEFERAGSGAGESPQAFLAHFANDQKRKVILRQTMSGGTAGGGSKGVGKSFGDVEAEGPKDQCLNAGARYLESVINLQFIPYLLNVNFGEGGDLEAPTVALVDDDSGGYQDAQTMGLVSKMINVPAGYLHKMFKVPKAQPNDPIAGKDEGAIPGQMGGGGSFAPFGYSASGDEYGNPEDEDQGQYGQGGDQEYQARAARGMPNKPRKQLTAASAAQTVSKALTTTAQPLLDRFKSISEIDDADVKKQMLTKLLLDLPKISKAMQKDPTLGESLAQAIKGEK